MTPVYAAKVIRSPDEWPVRHSRAALVILTLVALLSAVAAARIPLDRLALPQSVTLRVNVDLPGIDAATVENLVTVPLEQELAKLPEHHGVESRSQYGGADVLLRFPADIERNRVLARVRALVAQTLPSLPAGMRTPTVTIASTLIPPAAVYVVSAKTLSDGLVRWVKDVLADPLREVPEIASVVIEGMDQRTIRIQPDPRRMAALGLSFDDLIQAVGHRRMTPARKSEHGGQVATPGSAESIAARAVRLPNGEPVALAEVASVSLVDEPAAERLHYGNAPALQLKIYPRTVADGVTVAERVHAHLSWLRANSLIPPGASVHSLHNEARAMAHWLGQLLQRAGLCVALILGVIGAIFGARILKSAALAFVVWVPAAVALLVAVGLALNVSTTAGLMLAAAPFATMLVARFAVTDLRRIAVIGALAWLAGLAFIGGAQMSAAFVLGLLPAAFVRWLMTPWLVRNAAASEAPDDVKPVAWHAMRWRVAAKVTAILALITVGVSVYVLPAVAASKNGGSFTLRLRGKDAERLRSIVDPLVVSLHVIPYVDHITSSTEQDDTWRLKLDREQMQLVGVGLAEVGRALAIAGNGLVVGEIVNADRDLRLLMQLAPGAAGESFERLLLRGETTKHPAIYLRQVGEAKKVPASRERVRIDGEPAVEMTARWRNADAREGLEDFCGRIEVPQGYTLDCVIRDSAI